MNKLLEWYCSPMTENQNSLLFNTWIVCSFVSAFLVFFTPVLSMLLLFILIILGAGMAHKVSAYGIDFSKK